MKLEPQNLARCFVVLILKLSFFSSVRALALGQDQDQGCENDVLMRCYSLVELSSGGVDRMCQNLEQSQYCIKEYTKRCMSDSEQARFNQLYRGTNGVIEDLCHDGPYQKEFIQHVPCVQQVHRDYDTCAVTYQEKLKDLNRKHSTNQTKSHSEDAVQEICCAFQSYVECYTQSVEETCGPDTGEFTKNFLNKMGDTLMVYCMNYHTDSESCRKYRESSAAIRAEDSLAMMLILLLWQLMRT